MDKNVLFLGVPGKLDHASIVCYEVGYHDDSQQSIRLDATKSTVAEAKELKTNKKGIRLFYL